MAIYGSDEYYELAATYLEHAADCKDCLRTHQCAVGDILRNKAYGQEVELDEDLRLTIEYEEGKFKAELSLESCGDGSIETALEQIADRCKQAAIAYREKGTK